ncbi:MAG: FeoA family protein [Bacillota bacterium]
MKLTDLENGDKVSITKLSANGKKRRRLLDLGLIPGTKIKAIRKSPSGDPTAYLIRGSILALRKEETDLVLVKKIKNNNNKEGIL